MARYDELKPWEHRMQKHRDNLNGIISRPPQGRHREHTGGDVGGPEGSMAEIISRCRRCQTQSRHYAVEARRAEIGRENRQMVERMTRISKMKGPCAPPGPTGYNPSPGLTQGGGIKPPLAPEKERKSLNDSGRRQEQQRVDRENAHMVRRILSIKSGFSSAADAKTYAYHQRTVNNLQKLPTEPRKRPGSLPPLKNGRPNSYPAPARGLEALMLPSDLSRCSSGPGAFGRQADSFSSSHAATAPARALGEPEASANFEGGPMGTATYSFGGFDTLTSQSGMEASQSQSSNAAPDAPSTAKDSSVGGVSQNTMPRPGVGPGPEEEAGNAARGASAFGKRDNDTERRQWVEGAQEPAGGGIGITANAGSGAATTPAGPMGLTGMSSVSDLKYADDWDEASFSNSTAQPSRGPSSQSIRTRPENITGNNDNTATNIAAGSIPEGSVVEGSGNAAPASPGGTTDFSSPPDFSKKKRPR